MKEGLNLKFQLKVTPDKGRQFTRDVVQDGGELTVVVDGSFRPLDGFLKWAREKNFRCVLEQWAVKTTLVSEFQV